MKHTIASLTVAVLVLCGFPLNLARAGDPSKPVGLVASLGAEAQNRASDGHRIRHCSAATLKGRFGFLATGTIVGIGPVSFVGTEDFDGVGSFSARDWASFNGATFSRDYVGTYEVDADCTGTITFPSPTRGVDIHFKFVIVDGAREAFAIETDPGTVVSGTMKRL